MTLTAGLAICGAVLSTLLKLFEFFRDRANIKVVVRGGYKAFKNNPYNPYGDTTLLYITAVNKGRRPVTITKAALLMPRGSQSKYLLCADPITGMNPVELTEGKSHDYCCNEDKIRSEYSLNPDKYVACVIDATGRYFWSHNFLIRFLKLHRIR